LVRKKFVLEKLKGFSGRFLDLGCNRGYYLQQYSKGDRLGVDISGSVLRYAHERLGNCLVQGDAQRLGFLKSESVQAILCSEVIEHVSHPEQIVNECFRILSNGGCLLITTPNYKREKPAWVEIGSMADYGIQGVKGSQYFHTAFRPEELKQFAESAGFASVEVGTFEKEVKYATRLPVLFYYAAELLNKLLLRSEKFTNFNQKMLDRGSLICYRIFSKLGLNGVLSLIVGEGVRTFLLAKK